MTTQLTLDEELTVRILVNQRICEAWILRNRSVFYRQEIQRCINLFRKLRAL